MRNSGIVAVGHILSSAKDQKETLKALRKMVALMLANISGEMLHASAFALFDKFMSVSKANLENFAVLAMGILMKHGSDELEYQLKVSQF